MAIIILAVFIGGNGIYQVKADIEPNPIIPSEPVTPTLTTAVSESDTLLEITNNVQAEALTCTILPSGKNSVDVRITNRDDTEIKVSIGDKNIYLLPRQKMRTDVFVPSGTESLYLVSGSENFKVTVPKCITRGGSTGNSGVVQAEQIPVQTPDQIETTPTQTTPIPTNSIPEFQWAGYPIIAIGSVIFILILRKK